MLAARAHDKGLELVVAIEPESQALVHGDAARLGQVIANLVSNAIKFTAAGEVVVRARSRPGVDGAALVHVEVSDTGIGIERAVLERVFNPFSQADGSTTRKYGGTGLGLAISRQLIEWMGGQLAVESEPGKGSSFSFELSLPRPQGRPGPREGKRDLVGLGVLVVDDNATNRRVLERTLTSWQMSCEVADSATGALQLLESAARAGIPFAVALLDLHMPEVDGYQLAREIRARPALHAVRLMLLTSAGGRSDAAEEPALDGTLTKPVRQSRLYEEIQAVMAGERPAARRLTPPASDVGDTSRRGAQGAVLVVEDTPVNQVVAARMLEKCGFEAQVADNGRAALAALSERSYAAVLMDCQMPDLDGYETTREVRRREQGSRRTPIIAMTANSMQGDRERCLAAGMDDYLTKPLRNLLLRDALRRWTCAPPAGAPVDHALLPTTLPARAVGAELLNEVVTAELEGLDDELLTSLLSLYFEEAVRQLSELTQAISRSDTLSVAATAHKLKGASLTLGATHVSRIAAELESAAKTGDLTAASELLDALRTGVDHTREAFGALRTETLHQQIGSP
jgi:CheY-like chemotaxis protein/HPt (histidine-containing phosphotransfer) domain-containing protein